MPLSPSSFQSHLACAHAHWQQLLRPGDSAIDATCGNGHDTLFLRSLIGEEGTLLALDIQAAAVSETRQRLCQTFTPDQLHRVTLLQQSHAQLLCHRAPATVQLIVYNLGYLPGGDKAIKTQAATTLQSLQQACVLVQQGGALSITCYSGHAGGGEEEHAVLEWASTLCPQMWSCCHHRWINRQKSPSLLIVVKKHSTQDSVAC